TRVCPPTTMLLRRPFRTSFEIAWRDTPRSCAASAWEIHSDGEIRPSGKLVDNVNLFPYTPLWYCARRPRRRSILTREESLGQTPMPDGRTRSAPVPPRGKAQVAHSRLRALLRNGPGRCLFGRRPRRSQGHPRRLDQRRGDPPAVRPPFQEGVRQRGQARLRGVVPPVRRGVLPGPDERRELRPQHRRELQQRPSPPLPLPHQ